MIIHVAGTSGAGKSWVVRQVMAQSPTPEKAWAEGRTAPLGYYLDLGVGRKVFVVGAYEAPTGGCDTIKDVNRVYNLVQEEHGAGGNHVLYEGLFVMNHTRGLALARAVAPHLVTIQLTTPLEECFERIAARRALQGRTEPVARANTEGNFTRCLNYCSKLRQAGHRVVKSTSAEAPERILGLLREVE